MLAFLRQYWFEAVVIVGDVAAVVLMIIAVTCPTALGALASPARWPRGADDRAADAVEASS